jgi:hypothetical protein
MNIAISVANLKGVASLRSRISDITGFTEIARDNFHIVLGFLHAFEVRLAIDANWNGHTIA